MNSRNLKTGLIAASVLAASALAMTWTTSHGRVVSASGMAKFLAAPDVANIPRAFSYQGTLRLADGNLANGSYILSLRIYDAVTSGNTLHSETFANTVVRNGNFSVVVGDAVPISTTVFNNASLYLGITVAPDPEMLPRQRLFPVPWAMQAMEAAMATTLVKDATVNGLVINKGNTNEGALRLVSSGPGWGSGVRFVNTAGNVTWGIYAGSDGAWNFVNEGGNQQIMRVVNGGGIYVSPTLNTTQINATGINATSINASGRVAAAGFSGWCGVYPGNVTNVVYCNQDVAETFAADRRTEPGDLVVFVPEDRAFPAVRLSSKPYEGTIVGVVSSNPGLVFDQGKTRLAGDNANLITDKKTVVAMIGRVPTKFSLENGPIAVGDPLTSGSKPGTAMKATKAGQIIGYAMQSSDTAKVGKILVWLQLGTYIPQDTLDALNALVAQKEAKR
jgi:hypothetical protein